MSMWWYRLLESGDDFLAAAAFRYVNTIDIPTTPDEIWSALTADDTLVPWSPLVTDLRWTTPRPFGVGTTREVTILKLVVARERYYRWEPGRRQTFSAVQATVPALRRLAEDYVLERTPSGSRLVWTVALEPHPALRFILRLTNPVTARILRGIAREMGRQVG